MVNPIQTDLPGTFAARPTACWLLLGPPSRFRAAAVDHGDAAGAVAAKTGNNSASEAARTERVDIDDGGTMQA